MCRKPQSCAQCCPCCMGRRRHPEQRCPREYRLTLMLPLHGGGGVKQGVISASCVKKKPHRPPAVASGAGEFITSITLPSLGPVINSSVVLKWFFQAARPGSTPGEAGVKSTTCECCGVKPLITPREISPCLDLVDAKCLGPVTAARSQRYSSPGQFRKLWLGWNGFRLQKGKAKCLWMTEFLNIMYPKKYKENSRALGPPFKGNLRRIRLASPKGC